MSSYVNVTIGAALIFFASLCAAADPDYADSRSCATCHSKIAESYARTGMARSFSRVTSPASVKDFDHAASGTHFAMLQRDSRTYQRRWQIGSDGKETNVDEKLADFVMGSGNHVRTYLHRTPAGALQELPLAWYAERGGYWAMNPGYDQPEQPNSRRKIDYECMFCHNAYPEIPPGHHQFRAEPIFSGALPEGIDCQRCHGPGRAHVEAARAGASADAIRKAIVNPARLTTDRQMDVCAQCHLETSSFPLPHSIVRYDRGPFSYRPGEPLQDFSLTFDQASGNQDRFQIVSSVYRLKLSACFLQSNSALKCTTCHDPHTENSESHYNEICHHCHVGLTTEVASKGHSASPDCIACHMPKRRTGDVVHAVMTDHYIQRRKPDRDLLVAIPEPHGPDLIYHGEVAPYDSNTFAHTPENELYLELAQVREGNNIEAGIPQFADAIKKYQPKRPEFYIELGDAFIKNGKPADAIPIYKEAVDRQPGLLAGLIGLGRAFDESGDLAKAAETLAKAAQLAPSNAEAWERLGQVYLKRGRAVEAASALQKSRGLDPEIPETHYALATLYSRQARPDLAEAAYREAIRLKPDYSAAQMNFAILLFNGNHPDQAREHFETALRYHPDYALGHYNYGLMLRAQHRTVEARRQMELALRPGQPSASNLDAKTRAEAQRIWTEMGGQL
jgi:tetratricopeptide (TPR) repeat protein